MSIAITTKLKYPDKFGKINELESEIRENEGHNSNISLLKQMQNLRLNKPKYFAKDKKALELITKIKESKKSLIPSGKTRGDPDVIAKREVTARNKRISQMDCDFNRDDVIMNDNSLQSYNCAGRTNSKGDLDTDYKYSQNNVNNYITCANGNNLEIILEQETQRTETNNETVHKSPNISNYSNLNLNHSCEHLNKSSISHIKIFNPQYPSEYMMDIYHNLLFEEKNFPSLFGYMQGQPDLSEKMRAILVDWIIDVHLKFKLTPETLFLSVNLIDRYLAEQALKRDKLQLVGVAALLIACKYEEIFSPELRDFEYITDKAYKKEEIVRVEVEMLKLFQFNVTVPSSFRFFEIIATKLHFNQQEFTFGRYLLELFLIDYRYTKYLPSQIACSVAFLVLNFFHNEKQSKACFCLKEFLDIEMSQCYSFTSYEFVLKECCKDICFIFENIDNTQLLTVKKKFMSPELYSVSRFTTRIGI